VALAEIFVGGGLKIEGNKFLLQKMRVVCAILDPVGLFNKSVQFGSVKM
jgi:hypothetical protein